MIKLYFKWRLISNERKGYQITKPRIITVLNAPGKLRDFNKKKNPPFTINYLTCAGRWSALSEVGDPAPPLPQ